MPADDSSKTSGSWTKITWWLKYITIAIWIFFFLQNKYIDIFVNKHLTCSIPLCLIKLWRRPFIILVFRVKILLCCSEGLFVDSKSNPVHFSTNQLPSRGCHVLALCNQNNPETLQTQDSWCSQHWKRQKHQEQLYKLRSSIPACILTLAEVLLSVPELGVDKLINY